MTKQPKEKEFVVVQISRVKFIRVGKSQCQELKTTGLLVSAIRKLKTVNAG